MSQLGLDLGALLRQKGQRLTPQRRLILETVYAGNYHTTPDEIYSQLRTQGAKINRTTVYRTLNLLCELGLISSTTTSGGHLAYAPLDSEPHHHLVCQACGDEITISHSLVAPLVAAIREHYGFRVVETLHLSLFGVCEFCRSTKT